MSGVALQSPLARYLCLVVAVAAFGSAWPAAAQPPGGPPPEQVPAPAADAEVVTDVRIVGNQQLSLAKIAQHVRTRPGRPFDMELIEQDVRRLNQTKLFVNVRTYARRIDGGIVVVFEVLERPTLQYVTYIGNDTIKERTIKKQTELKAGDPLDPFAVEVARQKIETYYHEKGYSQARVTLIEGGKPEDKGAIFLINEGQKQRVLWTSFVGNTIASDDRLRTQIESKPGILWFFKGEVDRKKIDEDINRLTAYYRGLGFFNAQVGRELHFNESRNWLTLTFVISEGPRYQIRDVNIVGNTKFTAQELKEKLKLQKGQFFNQSSMQTDLVTMQDKYGGIGYVFADVKADPRFLEEPGQLDLVYNIQEGDRYRVGRININIKGEYPRTRIATILNRLSVRPGDIVDTRELRASERRLQASGLFAVDMANGIKPKITFSPPETDENGKKSETELARQPGGRRGSFRGQSPDGESPDAYWNGQAAAFRNGERVIDVNVEGELRPEAQLPEEEAAPVVPAAPAQAAPAAPPRQAAAWGYPSVYQAARPPVQPINAPIVRAQSPDEGRAVPDLGPRIPWPGTRTAPATQTRAAGQQQVAQIQPGMPQGDLPTPPANYQPPQPQYNAPAPGVNAQPPGYATGSSAPTAPMPGQVPVAAPGFAHDAPAASATGTILPEGNVFSHPSEEDYTRPLTLDVDSKETETGKLMVGVGVNSDAGLMGQIVVDERNFDWTRFPRSFEEIRNGTAWRGAGQGFRMEAVPGTQLQRYLINFREPYLLDTDVSLSLSGYFHQRAYREWNEQRIGGRVGLGYQFSHDLSGAFTFRGESVDLMNPTVGYSGTVPPDIQRAVGTSGLYGFGATLTHDTRDSAFLATEGHFIELGFEQVIGTYQYPRAEVDLRRYFTLWQRPDGSGRHVLSLLGRFSVTGSDTPVYERYFAGGFSTLRGFAFRGASPRQDGVAVGGNAMLLASAEYVFPITADDMLRGVIFCDSGTVLPSIDQWNQDYRVSPGFGLRIAIPAMGPAPIALDFAFPITKQSGDRTEMFSFFIGINR